MWDAAKLYLSACSNSVQLVPLQPITKVNSNLDKELQEWEVESTKGGANDGGG